MTEAFLKMIFEASVTAGIAAAAVMLIRIPLKKAPKRWSYMLWAVVFFRCLCPFSVESTVSLFNAVPEKSVISEQTAGNDETAQTDISETGQYIADKAAPLPSAGTFYNPYGYYGEPGAIEPRYADYSGYADFAEDNGTVNIEENISEADDTEADAAASDTAESGERENTVSVQTVLLTVWLAGAAVMAVYGTASYTRLMRKIRTAVKTADGIYETDLIPTAFSAGFFPPRVYIPCGLSDTERRLIVTHERVHIRRCDYITKPLAFIALALHWFNPLIWAAFTLMTRDMELSCDEAVLKICGAEEKKDYSRALLRVSMKRSGLAVIPLAFAETGIKGRVKNVLGYKKPRAAATLLAGALVISACAVLGTNAVQTSAEDTGVLLEKGTTEFRGENGERIFFSFGGPKASGTGGKYYECAFELDGETVRSPYLFWDDSAVNGQFAMNRIISNGTSLSYGDNKFNVGTLVMNCMKIDDLFIEDNGQTSYLNVKFRVSVDDNFDNDTLVSRFKEFFESHAEDGFELDIEETGASDGSYYFIVRSDMGADGGGETVGYSIMLLGLDDIPVYASESLNIVGHIDGGDADVKSADRVPLEKGTTVFEDGNGESVYFAHGDTVTYTIMGDTVETYTQPALRYRDESGSVHTFQVSSELKGLLGLMFTADGNGRRSSSMDGVDIDCGVSEITVTDICIKQDNGSCYVSLGMRVLAEDTLPEKTGHFTWHDSGSAVDIDGADGVYYVNADIKMPWSGENPDWIGSTERGEFGVVLTGFDDIPVYAMKDLKIAGHIGSDNTKTEQPSNTEQQEQAVNAQHRNSAVALEKGKTEFTGSGGERIFLSYKEENPFVYAAPQEVLDQMEKTYADTVYVRFPDRIAAGGGFEESDVPALTAEVYSQSNSGENTHTSKSMRGSHDILIDADVKQITVNDIDIKTGNDKILLCLDMDMQADGWTDDTVKLSDEVIPDAPETSSTLKAVQSAEDERICNIKAEIEMSIGNVGYGLVLTGFEDIPIFMGEKAAEKFVRTVTNEEVKQAYLKKQEELREAAKSSYPSPKLPVSYDDIGEYGANNTHMLFAVPKGTEVLAAADGTVKSAETGFNNGYGKCIEIEHVGEMSTFYAHLDDFAVEVGDEVKAGDVIGYSGSSGETVGDALLFEIRMDGKAENPWNYFYLPNDGYQKALDEISKDYTGGGIAGIYNADGTPVVLISKPTLRNSIENFE